MKFVDFLADHNCMSGIVSAIISHDEIGLLGYVVYYFALGFVAPLHPDYNEVRHR